MLLNRMAKIVLQQYRSDSAYPVPGDHVRIDQQRTEKVAGCAAVNLPRLLRMPAGIDGALDKPQLI